MKFWSELTKKLDPYVPGEQPKDKKYIKLNTNENPFPPSPKVIKAIKKASNDDLRLYPDPECEDFKKKLAKYYGIKEKEIFVGNGSDEVLAFSYMAFFNPGKPILFPEITYSFYPVYSKLFNIDYKNVVMNDDFTIDIDCFSKENGGIIIANPNAPTGIYLSLDKIKIILDKNKSSVVIIDEAYIDFGGESAINLINDYPNLLVIQTMSKSRALAGMRIGFAFGNENLINALDSVKNSFNSYTMDRLALAAAEASLADQDYFMQRKNELIQIRESLIKELSELGFVVLPSKTNFLFISHPNFAAEEIFNYMRENGVLLRYFKDKKIDNYLRVSLGTAEEMNKFLLKINEYLKKR
ncbi:histidinol-phosphate transaminase [Halanaerobiaceae bacterium ANBcell28]